MLCCLWVRIFSFVFLSPTGYALPAVLVWCLLGDREQRSGFTADPPDWLIGRLLTGTWVGDISCPSLIKLSCKAAFESDTGKLARDQRRVDSALMWRGKVCFNLALCHEARVQTVSVQRLRWQMVNHHPSVTRLCRQEMQTPSGHNS